jgi:hypothetical protein
MAIRGLMKIAVDRGILQLQVFRDSQLVIKWMRDELPIQSVALEALAEQLKVII